MNRIKPLPIPLDEDIQQYMNHTFPEELNSPNLYRIVAKNRELLKYLIESKFLKPTGVFDLGGIARDLREKIILRTCVITENEYEFNLHKQTISLKMGLTNAQVQDIQNKVLNPDIWSVSELSVLRFLDALLINSTVEDEIFREINLYYTESEIIVITMLIGFYKTVSMLVEVSRPDMDRYSL